MDFTTAEMVFFLLTLVIFYSFTLAVVTLFRRQIRPQPQSQQIGANPPVILPPIPPPLPNVHICQIRVTPVGQRQLLPFDAAFNGVRFANDSDANKSAVRLYYNTFNTGMIDVSTTASMWVVEWFDGGESFRIELIPEGPVMLHLTVRRNRGRWLNIMAPRI